MARMTLEEQLADQDFERVQEEMRRRRASQAEGVASVAAAPAPMTYSLETAAALTSIQFELVAKLLQTKEPARTAARLVLVEGKTVTAAAALAGVLQPSVSRAAKRCRETHADILAAYARSNDKA